ncbi:MAG: TolC family protein [Candidatus Methylomirabilia bacterium]
MGGPCRWVVGVVLLLAALPGSTAAAEIPLTLADAVDIALRSNPALAAAEGREAGSWAAHDRAAAERWPQLRLESRLAHVNEVPVSEIPGRAPLPLAEQDTWVTTASLQQLVYSGGRVAALVRQAGRSAEAAGAARLRARQLVAFGAERAFRVLLATQGEIGVAAQNLASAEDHLRVAGERFAARAVARFDVLRAEVQAEEARQEVIRADGNLQVARALLLQALGQASGEYRALPPAAEVPARAGVDELIAAAVRQRPDVLALERQLGAAEAGVAAARAERYPTLALAADYQYVTPESTTVFSRWSAGALVSLPILDGGRAGARRREAQAVLVQACAALDLARRQVEEEVRQAVARVATAEAQVRVAVRQVEQAEELSRLADVRFQGGVGTATEVADAKGSLARARYGLVRAEADRGIAVAELALAVGTEPTEVSAARAQAMTPEGASR